MERFFQFFFGTPQRALGTAFVGAIIYFAFNPESLAKMCSQLFFVLVNSVLPVVIVIAILVWIVRRAMR